ncbi:MAG: ABC transporter ATP-binding protein [Bacteroidota bacterium]
MVKKLKEILRFVVPYWKHTILTIFFNILSALFQVVSLVLLIPVLNILFDKTQAVASAPPLSMNAESIKLNFYHFVSNIIEKSGSMTALAYICILVVILFFLKNLFRYLAMYFLAPIRNGVVKDIRNELYLQIMILPLAYYTEQRKGDIISRMTADVQEVQWTIMTSLEMLFREPFTIAFFLVSMFLISPQLTLFVLVLFPISGFIIAKVGSSLRRTSDKGQAKMGELLSNIEETIGGLRIIKAFNAIDIVNNRFKKINQNYTRLMIRLFRKRDLASPLSEFLAIIIVGIVLLYGGTLILSSSSSSLTASVFIAYIVMFSQLINPIKSFTDAYSNIQKGAASVERIQQVLEADEIITEKPDAKSINDFTDTIIYRGVSFTYEKEEVLHDINIEIKKGKTIAVVGPSGAGKSTMVDLLPRFYDCSEGELLVDGINVKDYVISDLRRLMGIVTQETILFNESVFNNIAFGIPNVSEEDVMRAAKIANAHEFIIQMEKGYHTNIGDRGMKLSGGQKQRLSIARAVLMNPPVMILDEATSALDTESERLVQDALVKLMQNRTSIVIAHRLSTVQFADEIIVLQHGKIVERGNHNELTVLGGVYHKLCELQTFS